jgi:hypothetical protein
MMQVVSRPGILTSNELKLQRSDGLGVVLCSYRGVLEFVLFFAQHCYSSYTKIIVEGKLSYTPNQRKNIAKTLALIMSNYMKPEKSITACLDSPNFSGPGNSKTFIVNKIRTHSLTHLRAYVQLYQTFKTRLLPLVQTIEDPCPPPAALHMSLKTATKQSLGKLAFVFHKEVAKLHGKMVIIPLQGDDDLAPHVTICAAYLPIKGGCAPDFSSWPVALQQSWAMFSWNGIIMTKNSGSLNPWSLNNLLPGHGRGDLHGKFERYARTMRSLLNNMLSLQQI